MPQVLCKIPGAAASIGGLQGLVKFEPADGGMLSAEISQEEADHFASIPGFELVGAAGVELTELQARAEKAGLKVDARWKLARLRNEVEFAEKAAAEAGK